MRILVVEDSESIRALFRELLESHGHTVLEATTGQAAERALTEDGVALALVDGRFPWSETGQVGPNGFTICCLARDLGVQAALLSGDLELVELARSAGFPVALKPVGSTEVLALVDRLAVVEVGR